MRSILVAESAIGRRPKECRSDDEGPRAIGSLPRIRSESPAFDVHYPAIRALEETANRPHESVTVAPGDKQD
ncbi:hypothetical protein [Streptomyces sp. ALB3]|uniref:hypothetical protein n=1 Tax=Streptomyces sp. ALB3 TaxID=3374278 RepID=UPI0037944863